MDRRKFFRRIAIGTGTLAFAPTVFTKVLAEPLKTQISPVFVNADLFKALEEFRHQYVLFATKDFWDEFDLAIQKEVENMSILSID